MLREANRVLDEHGILILGVPVEKNLVGVLLRENCFRDHQYLLQFSLEGAKTLLKATGFAPFKLYFDLPRCRDKITSRLLNLYQYLPSWLKERISPAY